MVRQIIVDCFGVPVTVSAPVPTILQKSQSFADTRTMVLPLPLSCVTVEVLSWYPPVMPDVDDNAATRAANVPAFVDQ